MIRELIKKVARELDNSKIPYMVIGGQAVLLYGSPRFTRDIDITLGIDTDKFALVQKLCDKLGLKPLADAPEGFASRTKVLPSEEMKLRIRVDFIFSFTPYEQQAMQRVKKVSIDGFPVKFASCEDVIVHKMVAGRAIDEEDVKNILIKNKDTLDVAYVRKWLTEFGDIAEYRELVKKFDTLLEGL